jgi:hypothetical protein
MSGLQSKNRAEMLEIRQLLSDASTGWASAPLACPVAEATGEEGLQRFRIFVSYDVKIEDALMKPKAVIDYLRDSGRRTPDIV